MIRDSIHYKIPNLLYVAFLLAGCSKGTDWSHEKIHSSYKEFSHSKVCYCSPDVIHGLDLEFVPLNASVDSKIKGYLLVHSTPLPVKKIQITVQIDGEQIDCEADALEGGQRFLLSPETVSLLVEAFTAEKRVEITIPGYRSTISGIGFLDHFHSLKRSFMENPFHLPF